MLRYGYKLEFVEEFFMLVIIFFYLKIKSNKAKWSC